MKCADCPYYYKDIEFEDGESYEVSNAYCHYYWQDDARYKQLQICQEN